MNFKILHLLLRALLSGCGEKEKLRKGCFIFFFLFIQHIGYTQDTTWNRDISPQQKIYNISRIWKDVSENFAFFDHVPGLNWDSLYVAYIPEILATKTKYETYRLMERFICSLKDGHTLMYHFNELFPHYLRFTFNNGAIKILPANFNQRVFITRVLNEKMQDIIPLGSEILEVNKMPVREYLKEYVFPYIAASTEHSMWNVGVSEMFRGVLGAGKAPEWNVKFRRPDNSFFVMKLQLSAGPDDVWYPAYSPFIFIDFKWMKNDIAYIALNSFSKDSVVTIFKSMLGDLKKAKGIILDIRENGGGSTRIAVDILKYFTATDTLVGSKWKTRINNAYYKANGRLVNPKKKLDEEETEYLKYYKNNSWYEEGAIKFYNDVPASDKLSMPLVVLTGNKTASAAEDFLILLNGLKGRATTIGQRTNGSTGQPLFLRFPTGGSYQICTKHDMYPDGREFVGIGIIPMMEINPSVEDVLNNKDVILGKAIEVLKKEK